MTIVGSTPTDAEISEDPEASGSVTPRPSRVHRWSARLIAGLALGWLAFVAAHRMLSGRWWVWLLPDLLPPLVFVAVPLLLLALVPLARPPRWWTGGCAATALLLGAGLSGINPAALGSAPPPAPAGALRIVSFNTTVWNLRDPVAPSGSTQPDEFFRV